MPVEEMITNVERVLKKSWKEAENKGIEKGIEKGVVKVARQMLFDGESTEKIIRYTSLSEEDIEKLK